MLTEELMRGVRKEVRVATTKAALLLTELSLLMRSIIIDFCEG